VGITQGMRRLSVLVLLTPLLLLLPPGPAQAQAIAHYRHLPAQVVGTVAVGMPDERTVQVQHLDAATGQWDAPTTIHRAKGRVTCGNVEGRASTNGGVALLVECDTPYYEDQAPVHSIGLVSPDGSGWAKRKLEGEAYAAPAISPSGTYAAWLVGGIGAYVEWSATTGFGARPAQTSYHADNGDSTLVVDDAGVVTVLGPESVGRTCVLGVHTRDLAGHRTHTTVAVDPGCGDGSVVNVDADTVLAGGYERAYATTVSRTPTGWAATAPPPADGQGLVHHGYRGTRIATYFAYSSTPGSPVVALGSPDRRRILAQVYDATTRSWSPQTTAYTSAKPCGSSYDEPVLRPGTYAEQLRCGKRTVTLRSTDGVTWTVSRHR